MNRRAGRDDDRLDGSPGSESTVRVNSAGATEVPTPDPDDPNAASYHAWTLADPSSDYSGEVRVEIDGVTDPDAGDYVGTETLEGDDALSVDAEFVVE